MKLQDSISKAILKRTPSSNRFVPVLRLYLFYMLVVSVGVFAFSQFISGGEILLLEIAYALFAAAIILFVLIFSSYSMVGYMHGRLGFRQSLRTAVLTSIGTGLISLLGALSLTKLTGEAIPILYAIFVAVVVPLMQIAGVAIHGVTFADWVDQVIGLVKTQDEFEQ